MSDSLRRLLCTIGRALYRILACIGRALYKGLVASGRAYGDPYLVWLTLQMKNDSNPERCPSSRPYRPGRVHEPLRSSDTHQLLEEVEAYLNSCLVPIRAATREFELGLRWRYYAGNASTIQESTQNTRGGYSGDAQIRAGDNRHAALLDLAGLIDRPNPQAPPAARAAGGLIQPRHREPATTPIAAQASYTARVSSRRVRCGVRSPALLRDLAVDRCVEEVRHVKQGGA